MTDTNRSLSELPALIAERRRYESWLVALDARRDTTSSHVFERVESDYQTRLARVVEQVEAHRHIIDEERTSVQSRIALLEEEESIRRDERAELELRAHVGELAGDEATSAFKSVDETINQLVGEKQGLQTRINELDALLDQRYTPPAPRASGKTVNADVLAAEAAAEKEARQAAAAPVSPAAPVAEKRAPVTEKPAPVTEKPAPVTEKPAPVPEKPVPAPAPVPEKAKPADNSFDELAFLNTVVGQEGTSESLVAKSRRDAALVRDERAAESLLAGLANPATVGASAEKPLAANVTGNQPITLRAGTTEQPKTLKCNECGGLNYPTEWYCERCGAELAAL
jgi:hypothetical protein